MSLSDVFIPSADRRRCSPANLWSREDVRRLRELAAQGLSIATIARLLRRSQSAVRNKANMHGVSLQRRAAPAGCGAAAAGGRD